MVNGNDFVSNNTSMLYPRVQFSRPPCYEEDVAHAMVQRYGYWERVLRSSMQSLPALSFRYKHITFFFDYNLDISKLPASRSHPTTRQYHT